jgi:hypothetical protein
LHAHRSGFAIERCGDSMDDRRDAHGRLELLRGNSHRRQDLAIHEFNALEASTVNGVRALIRKQLI